MGETVDGVTKETFSGMNTDAKLNVLFDYAVNTHKRITEVEDGMGMSRLKATAYVTIAGVVGGAIAALGKLALWRE